MKLIETLEAALAHQQAGRLQQAGARYAEALGLDPTHPVANHLYGVFALQCGDLAAARERIDKSLMLDPANPEAHKNMAGVLLAAKRFQEAEKHLRSAIGLKPDYPEAWNNLSAVQLETGLPEEAADCARRALELRPDYAGALNNLGNALLAAGKTAEAEDCYRRALDLNPDSADGWNNLGLVAKERLDPDRSEDCFRKAIALQPAFADAHMNLGILKLMQGDMAEGFAEFEWRKGVDRRRPFEDDLPGAPWDGSDPAGKRMLVYTEQGLGDSIQFVRYVPLLEALGCASVTLACQPPLTALLSGLGGSSATVLPLGGPLPAADCNVSLMSLPHLLGTTLETVPAPVPYLTAEAARVERWRRRLGGEGVKIGIVWQGNPNSKTDRGRSLPLKCFAPLAAQPGVRLISLQKNEGVDQLRDLPGGMTVETLGEDFDAGGGAFLDTAAVMMSLDLIVTSDTAVAHLAGALGRPVWVVLKAVPEWRWLLDRPDSPWYPTMRLFRQSREGDWQGVIERVCAARAS